MCGRITFRTEPKLVAELFDVADLPLFEPRYNLAPTQDVLAIRVSKVSTRQAVFLKWGLIPFWSKDKSFGSKAINARAETLREKPAFREAYKKRRCLIVADGFFEWKKVGKKKEPYLFDLADGGPFAFAGLWERWTDKTETIESCTIITTTANDIVRPLHERMPVILPPGDYAAWLGETSETDVFPLLRQYPTDGMRCMQVSSVVNNVANDSPECVAQVGTGDLF
jgi:putative SOS response-associated peptidase YedK